MKKREYEFDTIRIIAMMMVLGIHTLQYTNSINYIGSNLYIFRSIIDAVLLTCNPIFFMMSGRFSLKKEFRTKEDYISYYHGRFIGIVIPLIIATQIYYIYHCYFVPEEKSFFEFTFTWLKGAFSNRNYDGTHLWYAFAVIALYLACPFLTKMLKHMSIYELEILAGIGFGIHAANTIFASVGRSFAISYEAYPFAGWIFYYLFGYCYDLILDSPKKRNISIILGFFSMIVLSLQTCLFPYNLKGYHDYSPLFIVLSIGMYSLLQIVSKKMGEIRIVSFLSKYSYYFYLIHMLCIISVEHHIPFGHGFLGILTVLIKVYCISFIVAIIISILFAKVIMDPIKSINKKGLQYLLCALLFIGIMIAGYLMNKYLVDNGSTWNLKDALKNNEAKIEGVVESSDTPYGVNAGVIIDDEVGESVLIMPNTLVSADLYVDGGADCLVLSSRLHPWIENNSDGAVLSLIINSGKENEKKYEYTIEKDSPIEDISIPIEEFVNEDINIAISVLNEEGKNEICDWIIIDKLETMSNWSYKSMIWMKKYFP